MGENEEILMKNEEKITEKEEKNTKKSKKRTKKSKNKEILADFLSQTIMVDKKIHIYIYKKIEDQFQIVTEKPFKPPLNADIIFQEYGDGIYRIDLRNPGGSPVFPNTIYFEIKNGIARQIPSNYALDTEKKENPQINSLQGAIILTPEAARELVSALKQNQNPLDLSFITEISKNFLQSQMQMFNEMAKNQIEVMKNIIENAYMPEEEEEEEQEIDQEAIANAIKEGNYDLIEELLEDTFGKTGRKFAKILRLMDGYLTAQKLKEEIEKNE